MNYFLGGDPGKDGAITIINEQMKIFTSFLIPTIDVGKGKQSKIEYDIDDFTKLLRKSLAPIYNALGILRFAAIEKSTAFVPQVMTSKRCPDCGCGVPMRMTMGTTSAHTQGKGDMLLEASMVWLGLPYEHVGPQKWQKLVLAGIPGTDPKGRALIKAKQLFPHESFLRTDRCTKPHLGLIDSALIAVYAKMIWEF